jgi:holo-[acyl-carrier protein] synthase
LSAELAGVGVALVSVPRFERAVQRFGDRLLGRLFQPGELRYARTRRTGIESLAVRLAAKWAGRDALAQLGVHGIPLRDLEVVRARGRAPVLEPCGVAEPHGGAADLVFTLSLTHDRELAMASIWIERRG